MIRTTSASLSDVTFKIDLQRFEGQLDDIDMEQYSETVSSLYVIFDCLDEIDGFEQLREEDNLYLTIKIPHQRMLDSKDPFRLMAEQFLESIPRLEDIDSERLWRDCEGRFLSAKVG
ncbi:MAG: hypothetical protein R2824_29615 [Saprospiraceae bacterium]